MSKKRSRLGTAVDQYAVPLAAAVVGWIVATRFIVPYSPAAIADTAFGSVALQCLGVLAAFVFASHDR